MNESCEYILEMLEEVGEWVEEIGEEDSYEVDNGYCDLTRVSSNGKTLDMLRLFEEKEE